MQGIVAIMIKKYLSYKNTLLKFSLQEQV